MGNGPSAPNIPAMPDFKNAMIYDESGNLSGSIVNEGGNIVFRPRTLTAEESINKKLIEQRQQSLLGRLYSTPEEYTRAAEEEAQAQATRTRAQLEPQYEKAVSGLGERMATRGLYGSKAYADIMKDISTAKMEAEAGISSQATANREALIQAKRGQDVGLYNLYRGAGQDYSARAMRGLQAAQGLYGTQAGLDISRYQTQSQNILQDYQNRLQQWQQNEPWRNYIMPLLQTGAMAYGFSKI